MLKYFKILCRRYINMFIISILIKGQVSWCSSVNFNLCWFTLLCQHTRMKLYEIDHEIEMNYFVKWKSKTVTPILSREMPCPQHKLWAVLLQEQLWMNELRNRRIKHILYHICLDVLWKYHNYRSLGKWNSFAVRNHGLFQYIWKS